MRVAPGISCLLTAEGHLRCVSTFRTIWELVEGEKMVLFPQNIYLLHLQKKKKTAKHKPPKAADIPYLPPK